MSHISTYFGYVRASTTKQELSPDAQTQKIKAHFAALSLSDLSLRFGGIFEDAATSGFKKCLEDRRAGAELCGRLRKGDHVVFTRLDRGFRRASDALKMLDHWREMGVTVHFLDLLGYGIDTSKPAGRMILQLFAVLSEYERELCRERILAIHEHRRTLGLKWQGNKAPPGFKVVGPKGKKKLIPDQRERAEMAEVHALHEGGLSFVSIWSLYLQKRKRRGRDGREFTKSVIEKYYHAEKELRAKEAPSGSEEEGQGPDQAAREGQAQEAAGQKQLSGVRQANPPA